MQGSQRADRTNETNDKRAADESGEHPELNRNCSLLPARFVRVLRFHSDHYAKPRRVGQVFMIRACSKLSS